MDVAGTQADGRADRRKKPTRDEDEAARSVIQEYLDKLAQRDDER